MPSEPKAKVEVRLDAMLSQFAPSRNIRSGATTVDGLLDDLETQFPRLKNRLRDETRVVRQFVKVFVNGAEVDRKGLGQQPLAPGDQVDILHSIQGG
jgi:sulfur-carrier protein